MLITPPGMANNKMCGSVLKDFNAVNFDGKGPI